MEVDTLPPFSLDTNLLPEDLTGEFQDFGLSSEVSADGATTVIAEDHFYVHDTQTLRPKRRSVMTGPENTLTLNSKSYHKCSARNNDPRCVCSAKLGLDLDNSGVEFEDDTTASHDASASVNGSLEDHECRPAIALSDNEAEDDGDRSRISSVTSEDIFPDMELKKGADSGLGSSRCGKASSSEEYSHTPMTPRDLEFGPVFSPTHLCESDPEDSSNHGSAGSKGRTGGKHRRTLSDSESSWSSNFSSNGYLNDLVAECERFMRSLVTKIFIPTSEITQQEKARFGQLCQHGAGRQWFAKYIISHRSSRAVPEFVFYQLQAFFSVCLFECDHEDDFVPAKSLMLMCFNFYTDNSHTGHKEYLYTSIKTQHIWKSLRFWNAAFFDAVHCEGVHRGPRGEKWRKMSKEERDKEDDMFSHIVFKQLLLFTSNMKELDVSKELSLEFLVKQSMVGKLSEEQTCTLRENIEKIYANKDSTAEISDED